MEHFCTSNDKQWIMKTAQPISLKIRHRFGTFRAYFNWNISVISIVSLSSLRSVVPNRTKTGNLPIINLYPLSPKESPSL